MAKHYVFDIESDGFLDKATVIHSLVVKDRQTGEVWSYTDAGSGYDGTIDEGLKRLASADVLYGHNIEGYDLPLIRKLRPDWSHTAKIRDTLVWSKLVYSDLKARDYSRDMVSKFPSNIRAGSHKLEAWGYRMDLLKDDYAKRMKEKGIDPWSAWNPDMQHYCEIDVEVTDRLINWLEAKRFSERSIQLEHDVRRIIDRQEANGFGFDEEAGTMLYVELSAKREELRQRLQEQFPPFYLRSGSKDVYPKRTINYKDPMRASLVEGAPYCRIQMVDFNPSSALHIEKMLRRHYNWEPVEFTETGQAQMDEDVLKQLAQLDESLGDLAEYAVVVKRLSQLSEGNQAWLKRVKDGRLHGRVDTMGTITGRMSHSNPNLAQVPANGKPYGAQCRALFRPTRHAEGWVQVGVDADGIEARVFGAYLSPYDGGAYLKVVLEGNKDDGTDNHSRNRDALGFPKTKEGRNHGKRWFYAMLYGAGPLMLGQIAAEALGKVGLSEDKLKRMGRDSKKRFLRNIDGMEQLLLDVQSAAKRRGWLKGVDGRKLWVRSIHSALNLIFQSAGAVIMKEALVILDGILQADGHTPGVDYEFMANVHDEWQIECRPELAEYVGQMGAAAMELAGRSLNFPAPISGSAEIGGNWSETH